MQHHPSPSNSNRSGDKRKHSAELGDRYVGRLGVFQNDIDADNDDDDEAEPYIKPETWTEKNKVKKEGKSGSWGRDGSRLSSSKDKLREQAII